MFQSNFKPSDNTRTLCFHAHSLCLQPRCEAGASSVNDSPNTPRRPRGPVHPQGQTAVILMRHGMTNWNYAGRVQGGLDKSVLNGIGMRQAREAGQYLRHVVVDAVFCSPLRRAKDTLNIAVGASENHSLLSKKPELLDSLIEIQVPWQGLSKGEIGKSIFSKEYAKYAKNPLRFSYHGFSPLRDIIRRAQNVWQMVARSNGSCYLMVGHNQVNKALICTALGLPTVLSAWRQGNCCFNVIMLEKGKPTRLRLCNGGVQIFNKWGQRMTKVRKGCMRVILHQWGSLTSLQTEIEMAHVAHFYVMGRVHLEDIKDVDPCGMEGKCSGVSFSAECEESAYYVAHERLETWRAIHKEQIIVVSVENSKWVRALFAASIGMGFSGMSRLISDAGGVSVVDIQTSDPVGTAVTFVEAYNVGAMTIPDPLVGYTRAVREPV